MRKRLLRWLVCPTCGGDLKLLVSKSVPVEVDATTWERMREVTPIPEEEEASTVITEGALSCSACQVYFPIFHGVPRMLTYPTEVALHYAKTNAAWIQKNLSGFALPHGVAPPGEKEVLRNFSTQWTEFGFSGRSYWSTTPERAVEWMRYSLGTRKHPLRGKLALEVGIGIGAMADGVCRAERCETIGVDLGYGVDTAQQFFGKNTRLHIVQASVFALPFRRATFDVVYSHGVIHHTYSTYVAFEHLAHLPKENGMLYVWVYSHEDGKTTRLRRVLMRIECAIRPTLSRLPRNVQIIALSPVVPIYIGYQRLVRRRKMGSDAAVKYGWTEALIAARDRLTPPFAYRHSYEEVAEWFRSESYGDLEFLRDEPNPDGFADDLVNLRVSVGIRGFRHEAASHAQEIDRSIGL
jgi:uncharacterized protein YbaR (Trm112 family)/SAM-dependent methyltransferase